MILDSIHSAFSGFWTKIEFSDRKIDANMWLRERGRQEERNTQIKKGDIQREMLREIEREREREREIDEDWERGERQIIQ